MSTFAAFESIRDSFGDPKSQEMGALRNSSDEQDVVVIQRKEEKALAQVPQFGGCTRFGAGVRAVFGKKSSLHFGHGQSSGKV